MKKYLAILILLISSSLAISQATAGVRSNLSLPTQGIDISENVNFMSIPPVLYGITGVGSDITYTICKGIDDAACTAANQIISKSQLPPCDAQITINCIASVFAVDSLGAKTEGTFLKYATDVSQWDYPERPLNNLPQGRGQGGIWKIPGIIHAGGNDQYFASTFLDSAVSKPAGSVISTEKFRGERFESTIAPVNEISGGFRQAFPSDSSHPSSDGSKNGGVGASSDLVAAAASSCIMIGNGTCQSIKEFPKDYRFGLIVILGLNMKGWFHGRIYQPNIDVSSLNGSQVITVEALPVQVPTLNERVPSSEITGDFRTLLESDKTYSTGAGYFMPGNSGLEAFELAGYWLPLLKDKATTSRTYWNVRSLNEQQDDSVYRCSSADSSLAGIVTTNSLVYSAGPPTYNKSEESLDYKLLSPHFTASGEVAIGSYDLVLRSDVARCIYGFSQAPIQATISIISSDGENKVATTLIREKNGWLTLSAQGFTFSSPTVRVKLSQDVPVVTPVIEVTKPAVAPAAAKKASITCVKGKTSKKVTAIKPKCPTGFKKKA